MRTMKTWQNFAADSGTATTRWNYDPYRGRLASKDYPDATTGQPPVQEGTGGPTYTYTGAGRASTRVWKRGITTTYGYNNAGDLASISYSDTTPGTTNSYDRRGRRTQAVRNGITTAITFNDAAQPLTETYTGGTLDGLAMSWAYDSSLRLQSVTAKNGATTLQSATYGYDTAGRLQTVTDSPYSATYTYQANSTLINTLTFTNSGAAGMVTTRTYDKLNRLTLISSKAYGAAATNLPTSFAYQYNAANQRTRATLGDGSFWVYQYDALGQVISGTHFWGDGTPIAGQDFSYAFDDIGNRTSTGGRASALSSYTANRLNQYSSRTVAPYVDLLGIANPTTNVTVNGNVANRKGEYFHYPLNVPNTTAQYPNLTIVSQYGATQTQTGAVYVAASTESFQPDADGNLVSDGRWTYTWDGENRLVQMIRDTDTPAGARQKLVFEYDHQGRRIRKQFYTYSGGWNLQSDLAFLYDGWNLVAELNANSSNAKVRSYVWGTDLSGSLQDARGVGGLLKVTYVGTGTTNAFVGYDGNGNVAVLTDASNGSTCAGYEYGPFAELLRSTGAMAKANPFRFSTKYSDDETGYLYYGYRYCNSSAGRWLSRDPIGGRGGQNVYGCLDNNLLGGVDLLGLAGYTAVSKVEVCKEVSSQIVVYPASGRLKGCVNKIMGVACITLAWADADVHSSVQIEYPDLYDNEIATYPWSGWKLHEFNSPEYLAAGFNVIFESSPHGRCCCSKFSWHNEKRWLYMWLDDGGVGTRFMDSPGGLASKGPTGKSYRLTLFCDDEPLKTWEWSYKVDFGVKDNTVVLNTPF
jgi:RHS repeat-associated protein